MRTIDSGVSGRANNFTLIRFVAASVVIWFHSYALAQQPDREPVFNWLGKAFDLGFLGVSAFFVVSGFLVTKSFDERRAIVPFVAARILRIYPGLVAATLFTIAVAAGSSAVPFRSFLADATTLDYFWHTALGWEVRDRLPGAFATNPYPHAVNGSLWTLPLELRMYVGCLVIGVLTLFRRPWLFNVLFAASVALFAWRPDGFPISPGLAVARQLGLAFALGAFVWVNRKSIPLNFALISIAMLLVVFDPLGIGRRHLFMPLFAYLVLAVALHPSMYLERTNRSGDYSYGLYIYAFPVQQTFLMHWPTLAPPLLFVAAFATTLLLAVASWHLLEQPALALKNRSVFRGKAAARTQSPE